MLAAQNKEPQVDWILPRHQQILGLFAAQKIVDAGVETEDGLRPPGKIIRQSAYRLSTAPRELARERV
jgi:hypothetical protein